jgi:hypothetical protein
MDDEGFSTFTGARAGKMTEIPTLLIGKRGFISLENKQTSISPRRSVLNLNKDALF